VAEDLEDSTVRVGASGGQPSSIARACAFSIAIGAHASRLAYR
jgi:hypothetical protein